MSGSLDSNTPDTNTPSTNARREDRFAARERTILLMPWGGGGGAFESRRVILLDCSAHGLGLVHSEPMQAGQEFAVYLKLEQVTMVLYAVRHCTKQETGGYKIGARLVGFLDRRHGDAAADDRVLAALIEEKLV